PGRVARIGPFERKPVVTQTSTAARADELQREVVEQLLERRSAPWKQQEARRRVPQIVNAEMQVSAARLQTRYQRRLTLDTSVGPG
ncbi:MAG: hypothetical protein ACXVB2_23515, partial [Isosphaeraceae bacterium]